MYIQRSKLSGDQTNVHKSQARNNWNKGHERFTKLLDSSCRSWTLLVLWSVHFYWRTDGQAHANRKRVTFVRQKLTSQVRIVTRYIRNDIDDSRHINSGAYCYCNQHPQAVCLCRKICSAECVCVRACVRVRVYACVCCVRACVPHPTVAPSSSVGYSQRDGFSPSGVFTFPSNGSRLRFPWAMHFSLVLGGALLDFTRRMLLEVWF